MTATAFGCFRDHPSHDDAADQWQCIREHFEELQTDLAAARAGVLFASTPVEEEIANMQSRIVGFERWEKEMFEACGVLRQKYDAAVMALRNARAASAKFERRCDRCSGACSCVSKLNAEIHRFADPVLGAPSILRSADA